MTAHTKISGSWKDVDSLHVKVSGSWKDVDSGHVKISGVWEEFFSAQVPLTVDYLVVAGGGGGGSNRSGGNQNSGGGGAGGLRFFAAQTLAVSTNYTITVGAGGAGGVTTGSNDFPGNPGSNSVAFSQTSIGGGRGANHDAATGGTAGSGGSGGGAARSSAGLTGGSGTSGQGNDGGDASGTNGNSGGGGGGAGAEGRNGTNVGSAPYSNGGDGLDYSSTFGSGYGDSGYFAGGGGGSRSSTSTYGTGGLGGGGDGASSSYQDGANGDTNTGGGGGGGYWNADGGSGGSGVVIIKYPDSYTISVGTGLVGTTTTSGGYSVTTFTQGDDTVTFDTVEKTSTIPVSGYSLWLDGMDSSTFSYSSGSLVSQWRDKSGNNNHFSQGTVASQPEREVSGVLSFDGNDDWLQAGSKFMNNVHNGGSNTFFIVAQPLSTSDWSPFMTTGWISSANVGFGITYYTGNSTTRINVARGVAGTSSLSSTSTSAQSTDEIAVWTFKIDADNATASARGQHYLNAGSSEGNNTATSTPSGSTSTYNPGIGADAQGSYYAHFRLAEIIWYESELSDSDREAVRNYLMAKWGVS